jgi:hypothetical protein
MRRFIKMSKRKKAIYAITLSLALIMFGCVYLDSVNVTQIYDGKEVAWAKAGDIATFTLQGHIQCSEDHNGVKFVVGFLAPKSWKVAQNAKVTYKNDLAEDPDQEKTMSVIPDTSLPKNGGGRTWVEALTQEYGVGPNVLDDMEWVVFWTDDSWDIVNNANPNYTIYIRTNVGEQNLKASLGFFVNHTDDGFSNGGDHKKVKFSDECFEVVDGKGLVIDYCNDHYNKVQPLAALQDDFVTFSFNGAVNLDNPLSKWGDIYFKATAITNAGNRYTVNEKTDKTRMTKESAFSDTYSLTIWPADYFSIPEDEEIVSVDYWFTNRDETIVISKTEDDALLGEEDLEEGLPFYFEFLCE